MSEEARHDSDRPAARAAPPGEVDVREAGPDDAPRLAALRYAFRSALHDPREDREAFVARCTDWMARRLAERTRWRCWIAGAPPPATAPDRRAAADPIIGCVWVQRVEKLPNPGGLPEEYAYLSSFFVAPDHRGRGVGSALLRAALAWCDARGVDATFLWPSARSRPLYARHGFAPAVTMMERRSG